jgi:hypothetical protein
MTKQRKKEKKIEKCYVIGDMHQIVLLLLIHIIYNYISTILYDMKWPYMVEATPSIVVN